MKERGFLIEYKDGVQQHVIRVGAEGRRTRHCDGSGRVYERDCKYVAMADVLVLCAACNQFAVHQRGWWEAMDRRQQEKS